MKKKINILHLEDENSIVKVVQSLLHKEGLRVNSIQVESEKEFKEALNTYDLDLVIADYSLPGYNGLKALRLLRKQNPDLPFILFSGSIGEEKAIAALREGATDYVLKENIAALGPVVVRILKESDERSQRFKMQQALEQHKQNLELIMDKLPVGIVLIDKESQTIVDVNPKAATMFRAGREEIIGNICHNYICPKAQGDCPIINHRQEVDNSEKILLTVTKEEIPILKSVVEIMVDNKPHILESFVDISEQKRMESEATAFGKIIDESLNEIYIFDMENLSALRLNRGAKKNLQLEENECSSLTIFDIVADFTREKFDKLTKPLLSGKVNKITIKTTHKRKDGSRYPVESLLQLTSYEGKKAFVAIVTDISEREEAENMLQLVLDTIPARVFWKDNTLKYLGCNQAFARDAGLSSSKEIIGKTDHELVWKEHAEAYQSDDRAIIETQQPKLNYEEPQTTAKSDTIWLKTSKVPLIDAQGQLKGVLGTYEDITSRKRAEQIQRVMFEISSANTKLKEDIAFYSVIQQQLSTLLDTSNFIIAMYDNQTDTLSVKYMQDKVDSIEDFSAIPTKDTVSAYVIKNKKAVLLNEPEMESFFLKNKIKWIGTPAKCWLGVPLLVDGKAIGLIIVQSYEHSDLFDEEDLQLMEFVAGQLSESIKRKQIESRMYQLSRSMDQSPVSTVITDLNGTIQYVNPKFCQVTGYTEEEAIGQNPRILKSGETPPEGYKYLWNTIKKGNIWRGRFHNKRKNGTLFWEDATIGPIKNDKGETTHYLAVKEDISERVETEENMKRLNQQNEMLVAAFPSILMVINAEEQIIRWNHKAAEVFNLDWHQVRLEPFHALPIDWDWGTIVGGISLCRDQKKTIHLTDVPFKRKDGVNGFLNVSIAPFTDEESILDGYLIHAEDITERKIAEGQQAHTQKLESIGQLAAGIAHEINTPTQYIGDNTHFLKDAFDDLLSLLDILKQMQTSTDHSEKINELLKHAKSIADEIDLDFLLEEIPTAINQSLDGIGKVSKIVKAMKEFSHPGSKDKTLVDLNRAIENTITVSRNEWKYVAEVKTDFDDTLPVIPCFLDEFNQVILNIIINAAHAIGDVVNKNNGKGTIFIQTIGKGEIAEIRIKDTGTGIPESIINRIFDPFFTTKEVGKGTGQGLAISYDVIVNKHKGTLQVESEPGKGTTFIIQLPLDA